MERTFLIADVRGYTSFTREHGDAAAARLAQAFANVARDAVEARDGRVIELRGDEVLAVFSSPGQAVRAALELQAACAEETASDSTLPLLVGVGIDAGHAVPVEDGYRGAALNTAARLCSQATAGQVLVTSGLRERAGDVPGVLFGLHRVAQLKGLEEPVELIEATAVERAAGVVAPPAPEARSLPPELEIGTPLVGREHELSWLRGTWRQARRGYGRLVFVSGPAQIGKTRLAAELAACGLEQGAAVSYTGAGGAAAALAVNALGEAIADPHATVVVLDDLDAIGQTVASALAESFDAVAAGATMVIGLARDPDAVPALAAVVERANAAGDGHRKLVALGPVELREIAAVYAGESLDGVPLESIGRASEGIPGRVHELMSEWAEQEASRRLSAAAEWLDADRRSRAADLDFANNVIGIKLARLYASDAALLEAPTGACPYRGLASFEESDSRFFFGRERLVGELAARTVGSGLLAVVGTSGSGKSSVIGAGLLPSLRAGLLPGSARWRTVSMRPGEHPLAELEAVLGDETEPDDRLVLVVDQFEEAFTVCFDVHERASFVDRLVALAGRPDRAIVVLGLRADFYGQCGDFPELARLVAANQVLVGPMSQDELRRAIELPSRRVGVRVESALTDSLVSEIGDEAGGLPLLSTALVELWSTQDDGWLHLDAHERLGGVRGAVARLAEAAYEQLSGEERDAARRLFLRLVATGEEGMLVRRRVHLSELDLERDEIMAEVVDRLTQDRLLTAAEDTVEVAHEALLREWPRLQEWLAEDAQGRELREHLMQSARRWHEQGGDAAELYRGARLSATLDWAADKQQELNELEREFLTESRAESEHELARQRRLNRRLKGLLAGVGVFLITAIAAGGFALVQRSNAQHKARVALGRQLGAEAVSEPRIDRAMLLARESVELDRSPETEGTLLATLLRSPAATATFTTPIDSRPQKMALSPDGRTLAVSDNLNTVRLYDTVTRRTLRVLKNQGYGPPVTYNADGSAFVAMGGAVVPQVDVVDARTFKRIRVLHLDRRWLSVRTDCCAPLVVTRDGRTVFFAYGVLRPDGSAGPAFVDRWDLRSGRLISTTPVGADGAYNLSLIDHGAQLAVTGPKAVTALDVRTLRRAWSVPISSASPILNAVISPDGRTVAFGTRAGTVSFVDTATGHSTPGLGGHTAEVTYLGFAPVGHVLVTTGSDGAVIVWDPSTARPTERLVGHGGRVIGLAFSADGKTLYTNSLDGAIFQWDLGGERRFGRPFVTMDPPAAPLLGPDAETWAPPLAISPDSARFAVRLGRSDVAVYSTDAMRQLTRFPVQTKAEVIAIAWSRRGQVAVTGSEGLVELWNVERRPRLVRSLKGLRSVNKEPEAVTTVAFSPDGRLLAAGDINHTPGVTPYRFGTVAVWDTDSGRLLWKVRTKEGSVTAVPFSPDGRTIAVVRENGTAVLHEAANGHIRRTLRLQGGRAESGAVAAFAPDGRLATGSGNGIVEHWDPATGGQIGHSTLVAAAPVSSIAFAPTGDTFTTTGGSDGVMKLWTTRTQRQFGATLPGSPGTWGNAAYTPDGSRIVVVYQDGIGFVWPATVDAWEQHACRVAGRNLTGEEWSRFVGGRSYTRVCRGYPAG